MSSKKKKKDKIEEPKIMEKEVKLFY